MTDIDTKKIANQKVDKALALIERAQNLLSEAAGELCSIENGYKQWKMIGDEYDRVYDLWRNVAYTTPRSKIDLDSDAKRRLAKKAGEA